MLNHLPPRLTFPYNKTFPQKAESKLSFPKASIMATLIPPPLPHHTGWGRGNYVSSCALSH